MRSGATTLAQIGVRARSSSEAFERGDVQLERDAPGIGRGAFQAEGGPVLIDEVNESTLATAAGRSSHITAYCGAEYAMVSGSGPGGGHASQGTAIGGGNVIRTHQNAATASARTAMARRTIPPASTADALPKKTATVAPITVKATPIAVHGNRPIQ